MDFSTLETKESARMIIKHPETGEPIVDEKNGASPWIELFSQGSKAHRKAMYLLKRRILASMKDGNEVLDDEGMFERSESAEMDLLVDVTSAWEGIMLDGKELKCTPENARMFYGRFPFVRDQVEAFIVDSENFMKASKDA